MSIDHNDFDARIRGVLAKHGRFPIDVMSLGADSDLYALGMTSHATVNVMLGLEGEFDVELPDEMLNRNVFASIGSIYGALITIGAT